MIKSPTGDLLQSVCKSANERLAQYCGVPVSAMMYFLPDKIYCTPARVGNMSLEAERELLVARLNEVNALILGEKQTTLDWGPMSVHPMNRIESNG